MKYGPDFDSIWVHDWDKESTGEDGEINRYDGETHTRRLIEKRTARGGGQRDAEQRGGGGEKHIRDIEKPTKRNAQQEW